jgi:hypothetical protein
MVTNSAHKLWGDVQALFGVQRVQSLEAGVDFGQCLVTQRLQGQSGLH